MFPPVQELAAASLFLAAKVDERKLRSNSLIPAYLHTRAEWSNDKKEAEEEKKRMPAQDSTVLAKTNRKRCVESGQPI